MERRPKSIGEAYNVLDEMSMGVVVRDVQRGPGLAKWPDKEKSSKVSGKVYKFRNNGPTSIIDGVEIQMFCDSSHYSDISVMCSRNESVKVVGITEDADAVLALSKNVILKPVAVMKTGSEILVTFMVSTDQRYIDVIHIECAPMAYVVQPEAEKDLEEERLRLKHESDIKRAKINSMAQRLDGPIGRKPEYDLGKFKRTSRVETINSGSQNAISGCQNNNTSGSDNLNSAIGIGCQNLNTGSYSGSRLEYMKIPTASNRRKFLAEKEWFEKNSMNEAEEPKSRVQKKIEATLKTEVEYDEVLCIDYGSMIGYGWDVDRPDSEGWDDSDVYEAFPVKVCHLLLNNFMAIPIGLVGALNLTVRNIVHIITGNEIKS